MITEDSHKLAQKEAPSCLKVGQNNIMTIISKI